MDEVIEVVMVMEALVSLVWVSRDIYKTNRPVSSFTAGQLQIFTITGIGKPSSIGS